MTNNNIIETVRSLEKEAVEQLQNIDTADESTELSRRYDFTALSTAVTCPRKYVYRHVIGVPENLTEPENALKKKRRDSDGPSPRQVGQLFHTVVEHQWHTNASKREWKEYAAKLAKARDWTSASYRVENLIDAFFDSPVSDWDITEARLEPAFEFDFWGRPVSGVIDSLPINPDGETVILDFKTGTKEPQDAQLMIYLLAAHRDKSLPIDAPPTSAAFLRYDSEEFFLDAVDIDDLDQTLEEAEDVLRKSIKAAEAATYDDPNSGPHCQSCAYRAICDASPDSLERESQ